jgi:hypothetical protein
VEPWERVFVAARAALSPAKERQPPGSAEWIPLASAEDPAKASKQYPESQIFTAERLDHMARSYDPAKARAAIVRARSGRLQDAHDAAEGKSQAKLEVAGHVEALRFDGQHLHGKVSEIADRCSACRGNDPDCSACRGTGYAGRLGGAMTDGHVHRSIMAFMNHPQFEGKPYLRNVAIGWDTQGQNGLPPLNQHISGLDASARALLDLAGVECACRSIPEPAAPAKEPDAMDEDTLKKLLDGHAAKIGESTARSVKEATDPLAAQIAELKTAATEATAKAAAAETAARAVAEESAARALEARVTKAKDETRFMPKEEAHILTTARALKGDERETYLKHIEAQPPILSASRSARHFPAMEASAEEGAEIDFGPAGALIEQMDPAGIEEWISASRSLQQANGGKAPDSGAILAEIIRKNPTPPWMQRAN